MAPPRALWVRAQLVVDGGQWVVVLAWSGLWWFGGGGGKGVGDKGWLRLAPLPPTTLLLPAACCCSTHSRLSRDSARPEQGALLSAYRSAVHWISHCILGLDEHGGDCAGLQTRRPLDHARVPRVHGG